MSELILQKLPLLFTFESLSGGEYQAMFKLGDDLRQDTLITSMIRLMDEVRSLLILRQRPDVEAGGIGS